MDAEALTSKRVYTDKRGCHQVRVSPLERLLARLDRSPSGCWLWTGPVDREGYATMFVLGHFAAIHRVAYIALVGPIPDGLQLDHLCRVRHCANPAHLEPVTPRENSRRSIRSDVRFTPVTHCKHGHEFTPENTYVWRGHRACRACNRASVARLAARKRAARAS